MLPTLLPAILTGFALALARAVGEYGSVIFIAGNMPFISEIAPLLIIIRLEEFSYPQAAAIGTAMLMISFAHPAVRAPGAGLEPQEVRPMTDAAIAPLLVVETARPRPSPPSSCPVRYSPDRASRWSSSSVPAAAARGGVRRGVPRGPRRLFRRRSPSLTPSPPSSSRCSSRQSPCPPTSCSALPRPGPSPSSSSRARAC